MDTKHKLIIVGIVTVYILLFIGITTYHYFTVKKEKENSGEEFVPWKAIGNGLVRSFFFAFFATMFVGWVFLVIASESSSRRKK